MAQKFDALRMDAETQKWYYENRKFLPQAIRGLKIVTQPIKGKSVPEHTIGERKFLSNLFRLMERIIEQRAIIYFTSEKDTEIKSAERVIKFLENQKREQYSVKSKGSAIVLYSKLSKQYPKLAKIVKVEIILKVFIKQGAEPEFWKHRRLRQEISPWCSEWKKPYRESRLNAFDRRYEITKKFG